MIEFSASIKPYSVKNECGDFYTYLDLGDYYLLAVGDIGGHGSNEVYQTAIKIKDFIAKHKDDELKELLLKIHNHEALKHVGMTIFLAQVYKSIPLINYCAVGNVKSVLYRNRGLVNFNAQDGIVGYDIPSNIKLNMIKTLKDDLLIVTTDGVSFNNKDKILLKLKQLKNLDDITDFFTTEMKNDDDSLCLSLRFNKLNKSDFSIQYTQKDSLKQKALKPKNNQLNTATKKDLKKSTSLQKSKSSFIYPIEKKDKKRKLNQLENKYLFIDNLQKNSINLAVDKLVDQSGLSKIAEVKIKTFLHEVIAVSPIDVYIKDNLLQFVIKTIGEMGKSLEFLFENYYISDDGTCIINIFLNHYLKLSNEEFKDLRVMIKLNLDEKDFITYKEREQFLSDMAYKDNLTGIYNRNKFDLVFREELTRDQRYNRDFSVSIIDIDHFKKFNDTYGHLIGDEVLVLLADSLRENVRSSDTYARWGGEEFVLLLPETDIDQAYIAVEKLRKKIEELSHKTAGGITASFGVTQYKEGDTIDSMFKRCDDALYEAKENGRNMVCVRK